MNRYLLMAAVVLVSVVEVTSPVSAHKTVVSQYTFSEHVQPILERRCGVCHGQPGMAMPLVRYEDVRDNRLMIEQSLLSRRMPPSQIDPIGARFASDPLTARELDILLTWAAGGAPKGAGITSSPQQARGWTATPDLEVPLPPFTLDRGERERTREVTLDPARIVGKSIRGFALQQAAVVKRAELVIRRGVDEQPIAYWSAGQAPASEGGAAYPVGRDAAIVLRLFYQRAGDVASPLQDQVRIGLFFGPSKGRVPTLLPLLGDQVWTDDAVVSRAVPRTGRLIAVRVLDGPATSTVRLLIRRPDGSRTALADVQVRPGWPARYALIDPLRIDRGSTLEARVTTIDAPTWSSFLGIGERPLREKLHVVYEIVD